MRLIIPFIALFPLSAFAAEERWDHEWRQSRERQRKRDARRKQENNKSYDNEDAVFAEYANQLFSSVFYPKPRGLVEGSFNALKSAVVGFSLSTASFLGIPIYSFHRGGWAGLIAGGIVGSLLSAAISIGTLVNSLRQFFQGLWSTPQSIEATFTGKTWDPDQRQYIFYSLEEEARELENRRYSGRANHVGFYEVLGVALDSSQQEIKKAYRKKARSVHPDKNPDDERAKEQFLMLHEAYSTLSDEDLRANYDKYGASSSSNAFDANVFFAFLLDADTVEPFIGELRVSFYFSKAQEFAGMAQTDTTMEAEAFLAFVEGWSDNSRRRHLEIANNLLSLLKEYETGSMSDEQLHFKCRKEAEKISESAFGYRFLKIVGKALHSEAGKVLDYSSPYTAPVGVATSVLQFAERMMARMRAARKTLNLANEMAYSENFTQSPDGSISIDPETIKALLPDLVELAWAYIESDVSWALQGACRRLFNDNVGRRIRRKRGKGLRSLGSVMLGVEKESCVDEQWSSEELSHRLDEAFSLATMRGARTHE